MRPHMLFYAELKSLIYRPLLHSEINVNGLQVRHAAMATKK